jgi:hypothetical protein
MPFVFGKPGTRKYRGIILAQFRECLKKCNEILANNTKAGANARPPGGYLTVAQVAHFTATQADCTALIAAKN